MMSGRHVPIVVLMGAVAVVLMTAASAFAQDSLASARDLYASAAYEDALAVLNRLHTTEQRPADGRIIEQYRAFCLLALGRGTEAEHAIEAVVSAEPTYHPSNADVSPRVRTAFSDVRRRMLPSIIQQSYAEAKATFDRREFPSAADTFGKVLDALADPDVGAAAKQPPLSDLHTLAVGFHDLAVQASAPPPPAPTPAPVAPAPAAVNTASPAAKKVYTIVDSDVVPPGIINQSMPVYPTRPVPPGRARCRSTIGGWSPRRSARRQFATTAGGAGDALVALKCRTVNGVPQVPQGIITLKPRGNLARATEDTKSHRD